MRCTGVVAGGCSGFQTSTGRNPVNAIVLPSTSRGFLGSAAYITFSVTVIHH
jgi:hypothetical protein